MKHIKKFNEHQENLNISDDNDNKFEMMGPDMDEILDAIKFINENYGKEIKLKPMDWSLLVSDNYSIFIKFELGDHRRKINDENMHIRFINDMLSENDFNCKLYKTK